MIGDIKQVNLAVESYKSRSSLSSCQRLYNMYAENSIAISPLKVPSIFNTPGLDLWIDLEISNDIYGFTTMNNFLYVVCGVTLYKISTNKIVTEIGNISTVPNPVQMTENGLQVTILTSSGISYYYTEETNILAQITDPNYQLASSVCTIDGYTIFSKQESGEFFVSDLRNTSVYPFSYRATAEALSDNITRVISYNRQLYIFGTESIEIWQSTGIGDPPFQRINGAFVQQGCNSKGSINIDTSGIFWLGDDNIIYQMNGYTPIRVSTFGIENEISKMKITGDAISFIYTQAGHKFFCLTFPSENKTFCYDIITQLWHERGSFNFNGSDQIAWGCKYGINFKNLIIVNGVPGGKLYSLNLDTYKEENQEILSEIISVLVLENYNNFNINNLILIIDSGVGLEEPAQGSNPMIMFSFSIDGGYTWINRSPISMGKIGKYRQRINWTNLGKSREFIFRFRVSDPVKRSFLACYAQTTDGDF